MLDRVEVRGSSLVRAHYKKLYIRQNYRNAAQRARGPREKLETLKIELNTVYTYFFFPLSRKIRKKKIIAAREFSSVKRVPLGEIPNRKKREK